MTPLHMDYNAIVQNEKALSLIQNNLQPILTAKSQVQKSNHEMPLSRVNVVPIF